MQNQTINEMGQAIYNNMYMAYDMLNAELFNNQLPGMMYVLSRKKGVKGYHWNGIWFSKEGLAEEAEDNEGTESGMDEIAHNPDVLAVRTDIETLSTLAHEMCHQWEHHYAARKPKGAYHTKVWAEKMKEIGLQPSNTGLPGGKETGAKMTHYIIEGGAFEDVAQFIIEKGFHIPIASEVPTKQQKCTKKTKYVCPGCDAKVWGKPDMNIMCGDCETEFEPE